MKVLLTGGSGFLGRHLMHELGEHRVVPLSRKDCDLQGPHAHLLRLIERHEPSVVVHAAAFVGGIGLNQQKPYEMFARNMQMGLTVIEACRKAKLPLLLVSTVCAYPERPPLPFREADVWNGFPEPTNAAYGIAKKSITLAAESAGLDVRTAYLANLYGPGDRSDHVIPDLFSKFELAKRNRLQAIHLWGDGTPTRDFLHVKDGARGLRTILEDWPGWKALNVGTGHETSIRELANMVRQVVGYEGQVLWDHEKPNGQPRRVLDCTRMESLGFKARPLTMRLLMTARRTG